MNLYKTIMILALTIGLHEMPIFSAEDKALHDDPLIRAGLMLTVNPISRLSVDLSSRICVPARPANQHQDPVGNRNVGGLAYRLGMPVVAPMPTGMSGVVHVNSMIEADVALRDADANGSSIPMLIIDNAPHLFGPSLGEAYLDYITSKASASSSAEKEQN